MKNETPSKTPLLSAEIESSDHASSPSSAPPPAPPPLPETLPPLPKSNPPPATRKKSAAAMGKITRDLKYTSEAKRRSVEIGNAAANDNGDVRQTKLGHKFCFICCDTKRAVIFLNTFLLLLNLFTFTAVAVRTNPEVEGYYRAMLIRGCGIFVTFATLLGAYWYSKSVVLVGLIFTCYQLTAGIIKLTRYDWGPGAYNEDGKVQVLFPVVYQVMLFYAESLFISEIGDGIMSPETYQSREKYSCCCGV